MVVRRIWPALRRPFQSRRGRSIGRWLTKWPITRSFVRRPQLFSQLRRSLPSTRRAQLRSSQPRSQPKSQGWVGSIQRRVQKRLLIPQIRQKQQPEKFSIDNYTCSIEKELGPPPPIDPTTPVLEWPAFLRPIFVISMRAARYVDLQRRMKRWAPLLTLMPATDGSKISYATWTSAGRLKTTLTAGQIGCFESHARIWRRMVDENIPQALILEDDADITYTQTTVDRLTECLDELKTIPTWDVLYVGNIPLHPPKQTLTKHISIPSNWEGLYTYVLTLAGARKLLQNCFPIASAVDLYVAREANAGHINSLILCPPLNFVVPVQSDTDRARPV